VESKKAISLQALEWNMKKKGGTLYPTFRQPDYSRFHTFRDFCRKAAKELILISSLVEE